MSRHCRSCGADISTTPKTHFLCRVCYGDAARKLKARRSIPTVDDLGITPERVAQLIRLAHPDRHANSAEANAATAWLLDVRAKLGAHPQ